MKYNQRRLSENMLKEANKELRTKERVTKIEEN